MATKKTKKKGAASNGYDADSIQIVEGVDHVRKRPGMYIGGLNKDGMHHLVWEVLDNSVDEVINGHATQIKVTIDADRRGITIEDNGRGIPIDKHPQLKIPAVVAVFTKLGAGGKFDGSSYKHSGGLHGVGAAVANALAERLEVRVSRGGSRHEVAFERGVVVAKLKKIGVKRSSGTEIYLRPDPEMFGAYDLQNRSSAVTADTVRRLGYRPSRRVQIETVGRSRRRRHRGGTVEQDRARDERAAARAQFREPEPEPAAVAVAAPPAAPGEHRYAAPRLPAPAPRQGCAGRGPQILALTVVEIADPQRDDLGGALLEQEAGVDDADRAGVAQRRQFVGDTAGGPEVLEAEEEDLNRSHDVDSRATGRPRSTGSGSFTRVKMDGIHSHRAAVMSRSKHA